MKRLFLLLALLTLPVLVIAWHYGPGQISLANDQAAALITEAEAHEKSEQWQEAMNAYAQAMAALPDDDIVTATQLELRRAKVRVRLGELPEAMQDMEVLMLSTQNDPDIPVQLQRDIRKELATANYYAAWLMRLEGSPKEEWSIASDEARQQFRLLAESAPPGEVKAQKENLEATIRLARMDLEELKGKKLPKECANCKNVGQKCREQRAGMCKGKCEGKGGEVRKKISSGKGAGTGERTGGGS